MTIPYDPRWSPQRSAQVGRDLAWSWLVLNRLPLPDELYLSREAAGKFLKEEWLGCHSTKGKRSRIAVAVDECDFSNRFDTPRGLYVHGPGSFEDHTALGVLCHEVGHHVDYALNPKAYSRSKVSGFAELIDCEEEVSGEEFNVHESFAEAIRLFITNPVLLREGRPARWELLTHQLGLRPLHNVSWRAVLAKCPRYLRTAVETWLADA